MVLGKKPSRFLRERVPVLVGSKVAARRQFAEQPLRLILDIFGIAEPVVALAGANDPQLPSPFVDLLKELPVQRALMREIQLAVGECFSRAGVDH